MSTPGWRESSVALTCRIGEFRLLSRTLRVAECTAQFLDLSGDPDALVASAAPLAQGLQGRLIRSHPVPERIPVRARVGGAIRYAPRQYRRFWTDLQGPFEQYMAKFSSKTRANLRKKVRRFGEHCGGAASWRVYRSPAELEEFLGLARAVSAKTYQERLLDAGLPADEGFLEAVRRGAERDEVRAFLLFHGETPVAYLYCPSREGVLVYDYLGYDPAYRTLSPGTVLQYHAFESLFAEGRWRLFDFTEGEGDHKQLFATGNTLCADLYYLRPTLRNRLSLGTHVAIESLSGWIVRLLDRFGVKAKVKRFFRGLSFRRRQPDAAEAPPTATDASGE